MPLYRYVKAPPRLVVPSLSQPETLAPSFFGLNPFSYLPYALMSLGFLLIISVAAPIVYHELVIFPQLQKNVILSPLPLTVVESRRLAQVAGVSSFPVSAAATTPAADPRQDLTKASNWFPTAPLGSVKPSKITHYTIDIPALGIKNAVVEIGGNDLTNNLVQYAETASPGQLGAPVIFGHSILRQFYNPGETNPKRYMSIFSTIMTLKKADQIFVNFDGIRYTYQVVEKYEVKPEQIEVLRQEYNRQSLKLITCTPEGTYLRRGVIEAQLIQTN